MVEEEYNLDKEIFETPINGFYDIKKSRPKEIPNNPNNKKEVKMEETKKEEPKDIDDWAKKSNKQLKDGEKPYRVFSLAWIYFLVILLILSWILFVGSFTYLGYHDHFKSSLNATLVCGNTTVNPSVTIDKGLCPAPVCNNICNCNQTTISYPSNYTNSTG